MSDFAKSVIIFGAGLALGYLGAKVIAHPAGIRGAAVGAVSRGMDIKEKVMTSFEMARENVEDVVAEAEYSGQADQGNAAPEGKDNP